MFRVTAVGSVSEVETASEALELINGGGVEKVEEVSGDNVVERNEEDLRTIAGQVAHEPMPVETEGEVGTQADTTEDESVAVDEASGEASPEQPVA